jgi:peptidoglycan/LPS O-acetylase OafA/YrhL
MSDDGPAGNPRARRSSPSRVALVDGLRGVAAMWVVLFHASEGGHLEQLKALLPAAIVVGLFDAGHLGVPLFFVLSGFVMALTVDRLQVTASAAWRFVARRLVRLTPPYWLSIAFVLALGLVKAKAAGLPWRPPALADIAAHLVYAQGLASSVPLNPIYWTLGIEVQFYVAFAVMMLLADCLPLARTHRPRLLVGGAAAAFALLWPLAGVATPVWPGGFLPMWFTFMAGVLACWSWRGERAHARAFWIYAATLGLACVVQPSSFTLTALVAAVALAAAGAAGRIDRWLTWPALQFAGLVSYSLYLLHNPITGAGFHLVRRVVPPGPVADIVGLAASIAICLVVAWLAWRFAERPSQRWSRRIAVAKDRPPPLPSAS